MVRYYHLSLDSLVDFLPAYEQEHEFLTDMVESLGKTLRRYCDQIKRKYEDDSRWGLMLEGRTRSWLDRRKIARAGHRYKDTPKFDRYGQTILKFVKRVNLEFTDEDYKEFISDKENFHVDHFPLYLRNFCEKHCITDYEKVDETGKCYLEDEAFFAMLDMSANILQGNVKTFWQKLFCNELYRKDI